MEQTNINGFMVMLSLFLKQMLTIMFSFTCTHKQALIGSCVLLTRGLVLGVDTSCHLHDIVVNTLL